jgi:hypothetical protein
MKHLTGKKTRNWESAISKKKRSKKNSHSLILLQSAVAYCLLPVAR